MRRTHHDDDDGDIEYYWTPPVPAERDPWLMLDILARRVGAGQSVAKHQAVFFDLVARARGGSQERHALLAEGEAVFGYAIDEATAAVEERILAHMARSA